MSKFAAEIAQATPLAEIIGQLNRGNYAWESGEPITYTFAQSLPAYAFGKPEYFGFGSFNGRQMDMARLALSTWADVADISFVETYNESAKISFANSTHLAVFSAAHAYLPATADWGGDVWVNSSKIYNLIPTLGSYGFQVLVHEIGHALGQPHPGNYNANGGILTYANNAVYYEDSGQFSIMSYWDETYTGADFGYFYSQTPMLHDIAAIQAKYGANLGTRADDTVYGFNSNTGSIVFDFSKNKYPVLSIWDGGGVDTIDLSGFASNSEVNLNSGSFSSVAGLKKNISIAYGADIENAITGAAHDIITGNALDNIVDGGEGLDTFFVNTDQSLAHIYVFDDGRVVLMSNEGTDQLKNIEDVAFSDGSVALSSLRETSILEYAASYADLAAAFGTDKEMLYAHLTEYGLAEGRTIHFSALDYIASHPDLIDAFGPNLEAGVRHFIEYGRAEGRAISFSAVDYIAAYQDLIDVFGADVEKGARHFIEHGRAEGRGLENYKSGSIQNHPYALEVVGLTESKTVVLLSESLP